MEIVVEFDSEEATSRQIASRGNSFSIYEQQAWAKIPGEKYPQKITVRLTSEQSPYAIGSYLVSPSSIFVNRFGSLQLKQHLALVKTT